MTFYFYPYPHPSPSHPHFQNVMKIFMKVFYLSFSFRDMQIDSFALLALASIIVLLESTLNSLYQKQPSSGVLRKRCSENMQQIYSRTPMSKCDFNKVACNFIEVTFWHGCSSVNFPQIFRTPFPKNASGRLLLLYSHTAKSIHYFV